MMTDDDYEQLFMWQRWTERLCHAAGEKTAIDGPWVPGASVDRVVAALAEQRGVDEPATDEEWDALMESSDGR